jgi:TonB-dependent starch-binding outer membrane protein SusC
MRKFLQISFALLLLATAAWAQERTVSGRVTSKEDGSGLPGVNVVVKGTTTGTVTDVDGNFRLSVAGSGGSLVFSFIGLQTEEVVIGDRNIVDVSLSLDVTQLSEIVVTGQGYGIEKKRLSTTVDVVNKSQIDAVPGGRLDQLLQSQLPNAQIRLSSGQPGTASLIRTRGPVSANTSTTPVIYIDGVRVDNLNSNPSLNVATGGASSSAIADIPIENIERIEYVKGGAATTLFGADAANGVIQIFTKKGTAGQNRVNFETQLGLIRGTKDFLKYKETAEILFRDGFTQSYSVGVDGGKDDITYSVSGNISSDNSFRLVNDQKRYNFRAGFSAKLNDWLKYSSSAAFISTDFGRDYNANSSFSAFANLEGGSNGDLSLLKDASIDSLKEVVRNYVSLTDITETVRRFQNSHSFELKVSNKVSGRINLGVDSRVSKQQNIQTNAFQIAVGAVAPGTTDQGNINIAERKFSGITGDINFQYRESLNKFSFITTGGGQFFRNVDEQITYTATGVTEGSRSINNSSETVVTDFLRTVTNYGFFAQENIGFNDKVFLEFGIRLDGNSAFGDEIGLQAFPKVGLSYSLSDENFFANAIPENILSNVKLRANYGEAGNFPTPFVNERLVAVNPYLGTPTFTFGVVGDENLKPERTATTEFGIDLGFIKNRINLQLTRFKSTTTDALFTAPFASSLGQINQLRNIGEIENEGWELGTSFVILDSDDVTLNLNASVNTVDNVVVSSGGAPEFNVGGFIFLGSFVKQGLPLGYLRGSRPTFAEDGTLANVEQNANLGSPIADVFGTLSLNFTFKKRISVFVSGDYQQGAQGVAVDDVLRYFGGVQDEGRIPDNSLAESFSDLAGVWVEDTDYLKVRNISVFYTLPSNLYGKVFKKIDVGVNVINPFNFVSSSFDPEITGAGIGAQGAFGAGGFGFGTESAPRSFIATVRLSL